MPLGHIGLNYKAPVTVDPSFTRPAQVDVLLGDATKARTTLGDDSRTAAAGIAKADLKRHGADRYEGPPLGIEPDPSDIPSTVGDLRRVQAELG